MEKSLKHFEWLALRATETDGARKGRIAALVDGTTGTFTLRQIVGQAPPPAILPAVMYEMGIVGPAVRLHARRIHPCAVQTICGMSGSVNHLLRVLRDEELGDAPIVARLHVSMAGKLNEGWTGFLGDLPPLLSAAGLWPPTHDHVLNTGLSEVPVFQGPWEAPELRTCPQHKRVGGRQVDVLDDEATGFIVAVVIEGMRVDVGVSFVPDTVGLGDSDFEEFEELLATCSNLDLRRLGWGGWLIEEHSDE